MTNIARRDEDPARRLINVIEDPMMKAAIRRALPSHVTPERMLRIITTAIRASPKLAECHPGSFIGSVLQFAQLGLEPNTPLGHAFLVPFRNTKQNITVCTPIIGYKGMIHLAQQSGRLMSLNAAVAREGDEFSYQQSFQPEFTFKRKARLNAKLTHAWCYGLYANGGRFMEVLEAEDVLARKARSPAAKSWTSTWKTNEDKMWRKTAVRAAQWQLPQTPEQQRAVVLARAEDGDISWVDAYDPAIAELLDETHMLPPEPDGPPVDEPAKPSQNDDDRDLNR